jgi:hypothetical protein
MGRPERFMCSTFVWAVGLLALTPATVEAKKGKLAISVTDDERLLGDDDRREVEQLSATLARAAGKRLLGEGIAGVRIRVARTERVSHLLCGATPTIVIDSAVVEAFLDQGNVDHGRLTVAFMIAHELGHLPECDGGPEAEVEADSRARQLLTKAFGSDSKLFFGHPMGRPDYYDEALAQRRSTIVSPEDLVTWAGDCLRAQELQIRDGRLFSDFLNLNISPEETRYFAPLPVNCAAELEQLAWERPDLSTPEFERLQGYAKEVNETLLFYFKADPQQLMPPYERWQGMGDMLFSLSAGFEGTGPRFDALGWRVAYELRAGDRWYRNGGVRVAFRELRARVDDGTIEAGKPLARTLGIDAHYALIGPVAQRLAIGASPSIGWEIDVQRFGPWTRQRNHGVLGLSLFLDMRLGRGHHLWFGASIRVPVVPQPGVGWTLLFPVTFGLSDDVIRNRP